MKNNCKYPQVQDKMTLIIGVGTDSGKRVTYGIRYIKEKQLSSEISWGNSTGFSLMFSLYCHSIRHKNLLICEFSSFGENYEMP